MSRAVARARLCRILSLLAEGRSDRCEFAKRLAAPETEDRRISIWLSLETLDAEDLDTIDGFLDSLAEQKRFGVLLFPRLRTADNISELVSTLGRARSGRWRCEGVPWRPEHAREDRALSIHWRTPAGLWSSAMGFAPLGSMPVTRRAPYVALVVWPGGRDNPHASAPAEPTNPIGFIDGVHDESAEGYEDKKRKSTARTKSLLADPAEDIPWLRKVAFVLPPA